MVARVTFDYENPTDFRKARRNGTLHVRLVLGDKDGAKAAQVITGRKPKTHGDEKFKIELLHISNKADAEEFRTYVLNVRRYFRAERKRAEYLERKEREPMIVPQIIRTEARLQKVLQHLSTVTDREIRTELLSSIIEAISENSRLYIDKNGTVRLSIAQLLKPPRQSRTWKRN